MSLRLEMLQVARLAPSLLGEDATRRVEGFVRSQFHSSGGFLDRDRRNPDLYYTVFGLDALTALQAALPQEILAFLDSKETINNLDFIHLCSLVRCFSCFPQRAGAVTALLQRIEAYRSSDGGYNQTGEAMSCGSAYASFLAYGAYSDHGMTLPDPDGVVDCLASLFQKCGGWSNDARIPVANVPASAAAIAVGRNLGVPFPAVAAEFLLECFHPESGGFAPFPGAPLPDLLTTAVALHALDGLQCPLGQIKEPCLDYLDTLWTAEGGFHGSWEDDVLDLEYTYYGLLALGHLSL